MSYRISNINGVKVLYEIPLSPCPYTPFIYEAPEGAEVKTESQLR